MKDVFVIFSMSGGRLGNSRVFLLIHVTLPPPKKNTSHHKKPNGGSVWRCWNWFHREKRNEVKSVWK